MVNAPIDQRTGALSLLSPQNATALPQRILALLGVAEAVCDPAAGVRFHRVGDKSKATLRTLRSRQPPRPIDACKCSYYPGSQPHDSVPDASQTDDVIGVSSDFY
jgi:hypothetical protein